MLCDACYKPLSGSSAVLVSPCGHRVHANKCEGEACKGCKSADNAMEQWTNAALFVLGVLCGVFFVCMGFKFLQFLNEVELAIADVQRGLIKLSELASASPALRPALKKTLDRIGALIHKELSACEARV